MWAVVRPVLVYCCVYVHNSARALDSLDGCCSPPPLRTCRPSSPPQSPPPSLLPHSPKLPSLQLLLINHFRHLLCLPLPCLAAVGHPVLNTCHSPFPPPLPPSLQLLLITQYFDTLKDVGTNGRASTIFLPHSPGAVGDVSAQLRTGFLSALAAQQEMRR